MLTAIVVPFAKLSPLLLVTVSLCLFSHEPPPEVFCQKGASALALRRSRRPLIIRGANTNSMAPRKIRRCRRGILFRRSDLIRETDLTRADLVSIRRIRPIRLTSGAGQALPI